MNPVTFQINISPGDYLHSRYLLEHQIGIFHDQVSEVLLTFDTNPKKIINISVNKENMQKFRDLLTQLKIKYPKVKLLEIDYTPQIVEEVFNYFFNKVIPTHDFRGAPIYGYCYGIYKASYDYVLHIDSDMFFGGLSKIWIKEAINILENDSDLLIAGPLPGPPHPEGILKNQVNYENYYSRPYQFIFNHVSARVFFVNKFSLQNNLKFQKPRLRHRIISRLTGFSNVDTLERIISTCLQKNRKYRIDFLGNHPGLWSIHPNYRSQEFYDRIPEMINRVINNDIPEDQYGDYNFSVNFIDWSEGIRNFKRNRLRNKILRRFKMGFNTLFLTP